MRVVIVSPHLDDEVLGCSSWLLSDPLTVVYTTRVHPNYPNVAEENDTLAAFLGFERRWLSIDLINRLDTVGQAELIADVEKIFNEVRPELVLLPAPSYNQDHRAIFEAVLTAMRPHDTNWFCKKVLVYEQPETWGTMRTPQFFRAVYFKELDFDFKVKCYQMYRSQVREHRSIKHLQALAVFRGMQAKLPFAEAFEVLRWVE